MEELFCGCSEANWSKIWSENALQTAIKPDHGYTHDSDQIRWLIQMLASYNYEMVSLSIFFHLFFSGKFYQKFLFYFIFWEILSKISSYFWFFNSI